MPDILSKSNIHLVVKPSIFKNLGRGMSKKLILLCFLTTSFLVCSSEKPTPSQSTDAKEQNEKKTGNFANERTPGTYFGFGQYIEDEGTVSLYLFLDQEKGKHQSYIAFCPYAVYALTDSLAVYGSLPLIVSDSSDGDTSRGIGDLLLNAEYSFWDRSTDYSDSYATIVTGVSIPSATTIISTSTADDGSCICKKDSLGYNVPTIFVGATISTLSEKWYAYADCGATIVTSSYNGVKTGNEVVYDFGFGYNLAGWNNRVLTLLFDVDGSYTQKDKEDGCHDPDTGGHLIYMGPTLFYSHKSWVFAAGIEGVAYQRLNGDQNKNHFRSLLTASIQF